MPFERTALRAVARTVGFGAFALAVFGLCHSEHDLGPRVCCVSLALAFAVAVATASGRIAFGFLCSAALTGAVWLASALKLRYLHEPLLAPDLRYLGHTLVGDVVTHYPAMLRQCIAALALFPLLAFALWRLESPGGWQARRRRTRSLSTLGAALSLLVLAWPPGPFARVYDVPAWDFIDQGQRNPVTTFLRSIGRTRVTLPPHDGDADAHDWGAATTASTTTVRPDIVVVLEESTLDPRSWADCTGARCRFAMFEPDAATRAHGRLRVHTYGGATWTSEFAFLAGLPHTLFGPAGIYAPYNLVPRLHESLPRHLKSLGYRTIAVYPMPSDFVRAAGAYADYGFDEFHDAQELGLRWESTDAELFAKADAIRHRAREGNEAPLFMMLLTMRQHGPHDQPLDALPPPWNTPPAPALDARLNRNLGTYLYRLHESDSALAALRTSLFSDPRPTLLVHFGDHHPSFDGLEQTLRSAVPGASASDARSDTYFRIDANFPAQEVRTDGTLDLAFLGAVVLQVAGLPQNPYFAANARLRAACSGLFEGCPEPTLASYFAYVFGRLRAFDE